MKDGRPLCCQPAVDRSRKLGRLFNAKSLDATRLRKGGEIHVWENGARRWGHASPLHFQMDKAPAAIVIDDDLDWKRMLYRGHEFAEQHGETAIAHMQYHLALRVQCLRAIGNAKACADRRIVE